MKIHTFYFNPFRECTYLISNDSGDTVIVDCGCYGMSECERLKKYIESNGLKIRHHLLTHAHLDHVFGARFVYDQYGVLPTLSEKDARLYQRVEAQSAAFDIPMTDEPLKEYVSLESLIQTTPDTYEEYIRMLDTDWYVLHTPGHSEGSVCYMLKQQKGVPTPVLFSGDTLFQGGIGRTDLPQGDMMKMLGSLETLRRLPDETVIYPGHGYCTSIAEEKRYNPYFSSY